MSEIHDNIFLSRRLHESGYHEISRYIAPSTEPTSPIPHRQNKIVIKNDVESLEHIKKRLYEEEEELNHHDAQEERHIEDFQSHPVPATTIHLHSLGIKKRNNHSKFKSSSKYFLFVLTEFHLKVYLNLFQR